MDSKVAIAGAIAGLVVICATIGVAMSLSSHGQAQPSSATAVVQSAPPQNIVPPQAASCHVHGYVVNTFGDGLPGLNVTLHVMGNGQGGQVTEIYNMTAVTGDKPAAGEYSFDSVVIPPGTLYAYAETSKVTGDITSMGRTNNYSLNASDNLTMSIVLKLPP